MIVSGPEGLLLRRESDGSLVTQADLSGLSHHSWNEIVVDGRGNVYVNSVSFDFMGEGEFAPGIIALVSPDGSVRQVADGLAFPNGMAVTPDNSTLIVAESFAGRLAAFDVAADGGLSNRRVWADLGEGGDGICMDAEGAVWCPAGDMPARPRRRRGSPADRARPELLRLHARRPGQEDAVHDGGGLARREHLSDGPRSGQVLTAQAPAPGVGWPNVSGA